MKKFTAGKFMIRGIDPELWKEFQILCLKRDLYPNDMLLKILEDFVKKNSKRERTQKKRGAM